MTDDSSHQVQVLIMWWKQLAHGLLLFCIYLCIWELDLRLNNVNYSCWYYLSPIIIISLYWTSETLLSSSITTSEYLICDTILEVKTAFDIIFIQKLFWSLIHFIPSSSNYEGETLVSVVNHSNWLMFIRSNTMDLIIQELSSTLILGFLLSISLFKKM